MNTPDVYDRCSGRQEKYMDCTIFVIWNNKEVFDSFVDDIKKQIGIEYQLISIDNSDDRYIGARQAFKLAFSSNEIFSDILVFLHPDIRFLKNDSLRNVIHQVKQIGEFGVVGVAGCKAQRKWEIYSNIVNGKNKVMPGKVIEKAVEVQTVDECLFIIEKRVYQKYPFSTLPGWHLYAVEQCINYINKGYHNYVIPADIWHLSAGASLDEGYMYTLEHILYDIRTNEEYHIIELNTTVKQWKIKGLLPAIYRFYYRYKQRIKKILLKR